MINETSENLKNTSALVKFDPVGKLLEEQALTFFLVLLLLLISVIAITFLLNKKLHFIPEALVVMVFGVVIAVIINFVLANVGVDVTKWKNMESFHPDVFFLVLLPPMIFESGYTLQKGDFFSNIGAILTYALLGTTVSTIIVGFSMYGLGQLGWVHEIAGVEAFAFGSLISATDPVSTLALFSAMNADQDLYAIVFGESVLNDAVSIILTLTIMSAAEQMDSGDIHFSSLALHSIGKFCMMFFLSSIIGVLFGLASALLLKHIRMNNHPSLECLTMIIFAFMPYGFCEAVELSGIMAILLCGITMSHYTHFNLSPLTQITVQQIFRLMALVTETIVFLYLGMAILNGPHLFDIRFISWSLFTCLLSRAVVVFPLSLFFIYCRPKENRISLKVLFLIWFSGLRGAVAFAQSLHLPLANNEAQKLIITTTLIIVVITNVVLGISTLPLVKFLKVQRKHFKSGFSKSLKLGRIVGPSEASSQTIKYKARFGKSPMSIIRGWRRFDKKYLMPFFIRKNDSQEYTAAVTHMIDRWSENEERTAHQFLTSSAEIDEHSPLIVKRTRQNIVRPVRKILREVDESKTEDESDSGTTPIKIADRVRFEAIDESAEHEESSVSSHYGSVNADKKGSQESFL
ncbi:sodium/hydrogen exchanger 8 isoform X2 [Hydra vulgaris]|uniref:Sodium/hydrogen exchanger n=2 Tax=Hydra vulgaris TaxID=6087 RepID=A0ABM4D5Z4_HYDVU